MCLESESGGRDERMHILRVSRIARRAIRLAMIAAAVFARARVGFGRSARGHQHRDRDRRSRLFCGAQSYGSASGLRRAAYLLSSPLCRLWATTSVRTSPLPRAPPSSLLLLLLTP